MLPQDIDHRALDGAIHELLQGPVLYLKRGPVMSGGLELPHYTTCLSDAKRLLDRVFPGFTLEVRSSSRLDQVMIEPDLEDPDSGQVWLNLWKGKPAPKVSLAAAPGKRPALLLCAALVEVAVSLRDARAVAQNISEIMTLIEESDVKGRTAQKKIDLVAILTAQG